MTWQDYHRSDERRTVSIGVLDGEYVMERNIMSAMASDFYKLTKEEYDGFETWWDKEDEIMNIRLRKAWCRGYFGHAEFQLLQASDAQ